VRSKLQMSSGRLLYVITKVAIHKMRRGKNCKIFLDSSWHFHPTDLYSLLKSWLLPGICSHAILGIQNKEILSTQTPILDFSTTTTKSDPIKSIVCLKILLFNNKFPFYTSIELCTIFLDSSNLFSS
jgi:hypothetical protein